MSLVDTAKTNLSKHVRGGRTNVIVNRTDLRALLDHVDELENPLSPISRNMRLDAAVRTLRRSAGLLVLAVLLAACTPRDAGRWYKDHGVAHPTRTQRVELAEWVTDIQANEPALTGHPDDVRLWVRLTWDGTDQAWHCFEHVIDNESSFDPDVWNFAGSSAWGLGQFLISTRNHYGMTTSTPVGEQVVMIRQYMVDRYGSECGASTHSRNKGWY